MTNFTFGIKTGQKKRLAVMREMQVADLDAVYDLELRTFPSPWSKQSFELELMHRTYSHSWVVESSEEIIAYAVTWLFFEEFHIANISVSPDYQHKGIATFMMRQMIDFAVSRNATIVHLEVRRSNAAAIALYKKFGFVAIGIREKYYQAEDEDAILMSLNLLENHSKVDQ
jgi:[ribosomal protein S18]-alanine N-acetyltransferase